MSTARQIIELALKEVGVLGVGQSALAEDTNDSFVILQRMVKLWQQKRWLVPSLTSYSKTWNGEKSNTVGPGGFFDITRPNDIKAAYQIQRNTGITPISLGLRKIFSYEDYFRIAVKELQSLGSSFFYDAKYPIANLFVWPIPQDSLYDIHILVESLLGFGTTINEGSITTAGAAYVDGTYVAIPLTGGDGSGALADITVTGGVVTVVTLSDGGENYAVGNVLSANNADLGGAGAGFTWTVETVVSNLDSELVMPPEYEEAIYYNLAIRLASMYQVAPNETTMRLAKNALNTIRMNNTQVPALSMPNAPGLKRGRGFSLWNPDGYGYGGF